MPGIQHYGRARKVFEYNNLRVEGRSISNLEPREAGYEEWLSYLPKVLFSNRAEKLPGIAIT